MVAKPRRLAVWTPPATWQRYEQRAGGWYARHDGGARRVADAYARELSDALASLIGASAQPAPHSLTRKARGA